MGVRWACLASGWIDTHLLILGVLILDLLMLDLLILDLLMLGLLMIDFLILGVLIFGVFILRYMVGVLDYSFPITYVFIWLEL